MGALALLIPIVVLAGCCWLGMLLYALNSGQYEDPEGAALRIFDEDDEIFHESVFLSEAEHLYEDNKKS